MRPTPLIDILEGLILHCFPKLKDGELMRILKQRTLFGDQMQDFLELLEKSELATADDEKDIQAVTQTWKHTKEGVDDFTEQYIDHEKNAQRAKRSRSSCLLRLTSRLGRRSSSCASTCRLTSRRCSATPPTADGNCIGPRCGLQGATPSPSTASPAPLTGV